MHPAVFPFRIVQFGTAVPSLGHDALHLRSSSMRRYQSVLRHRAAITRVLPLGRVAVSFVHLLRMWADGLRRHHGLVSILAAPADDVLALPRHGRVVVLAAASLTAALFSSMSVVLRVHSSLQTSLIGLCVSLLAVPTARLVNAVLRWYACVPDSQNAQSLLPPSSKWSRSTEYCVWFCSVPVCRLFAHPLPSARLPAFGVAVPHGMAPSSTDAQRVELDDDSDSDSGDEVNDSHSVSRTSLTNAAEVNVADTVDVDDSSDCHHHRHPLALAGDVEAWPLPGQADTALVRTIGSTGAHVAIVTSNSPVLLSRLPRKVEPPVHQSALSHHQGRIVNRAARLLQ
jgi:hypothetical protein